MQCCWSSVLSLSRRKERWHRSTRSGPEWGANEISDEGHKSSRKNYSQRGWWWGRGDNRDWDPEGSRNKAVARGDEICTKLWLEIQEKIWCRANDLLSGVGWPAACAQLWCVGTDWC